MDKQTDRKQIVRRTLKCMIAELRQRREFLSGTNDMTTVKDICHLEYQLKFGLKHRNEVF